jgi:hypothetical protein
MAVQIEVRGAGEFILSYEDTFSLEQVTLASGQSLAAGTVIGKRTKRQAAAPIPTVAGGTGNGTMTALTFGPDVQVGSYVVQCTAAVAHGGTFSITAPDGTVLPSFTMGTTTGGTARYTSSHISFSLTDGSADFITANNFTVVVTAGGTPVLVGTGTGVVSSFSLGPLAQNGTYRVQLKATSATAEFQVQSPDGKLIGFGNVATAYASDHINFTLANGGTMTAGDYFNVVVANGTGQVLPFDPAATDGLQEPYGILMSAVDATSATAAGTAVVRMAQVKSTALVWKAGITNAQIAACRTRQFLANNIIAR